MGLPYIGHNGCVIQQSGLGLEPLVAGVLAALPVDVLGIDDAAMAAEGLGAQQPQAHVGRGGVVGQRQAVA